MSDLLLPAYQKFYSALSSLNRFNKEKDFFNNISSLDTFFSEFRNITFVLQKSLAHTEYLTNYKQCRDKYLSNCQWFVDKRNETIKERPFPLIKDITIDIYYPNIGFHMVTVRFSIESDTTIENFLDELRHSLKSINEYEVFFSAKYTFFEENKEEDLYDALMKGIQKMDAFLKALSNEINEKSELCEQIKAKIEVEHILHYPKDLFLINDYVYYPQTEDFDKANRISANIGNVFSKQRCPVSGFNQGLLSSLGDTLFEKFVLLHVAIQTTDLMPTMMLVYEDDTFTLDSYQSSVKTTFYRKINEVASKILKEDIKEIYYMATYVYCDYDIVKEQNLTSKERIKHAKEEYLAFMKVDKNLAEEECLISEKILNDPKSIYQEVKNHSKSLEAGKNNLFPIIEAFKEKRKNETL